MTSVPPRPRVIVFGGGAEIVDRVAGVLVLRAAELRTVTGPVDAAVFDLRSSNVPALALLRTRPPLAGTPVLLLSSEPVADATFELLGADDAWVEGTSVAQLYRRIARLIELARLRRGGRRPSGATRTGLASAHAEIGLLQRKLGDRERFDQAILDGVEVGIVTTDPKGLITFVNRAAIDLLTLRRDVSGIAVQDVLGLDRGPNELLGDQPRGHLSYTLRVRPDLERDLQLAVSRGEGGDDDRLGFFFIFRDVSEEKQREAERQRFEHLAAMGTMVAGFAHEVRNPIAAMRSITEELEEEARSVGFETPHVAVLLQMIERIERLVRTSLRFGRPAAAKRARCHPNAIVTSALTELRLQQIPVAPIVLDVEGGLPDVHVDESQIAQALVILLHNAIESTGSVARVTIRASRQRRPDPEHRRRSEPPGSAYVRLEVVDDGPGIPAELLGRIFDPFFTTKPTGTGLGLSIAQRLASENGASLEVASTQGGLTSFSVILLGLPSLAAANPPATPVGQPSRDPDPGGTSFGRERRIP